MYVRASVDSLCYVMIRASVDSLYYYVLSAFMHYPHMDITGYMYMYILAIQYIICMHAGAT